MVMLDCCGGGNDFGRSGDGGKCKDIKNVSYSNRKLKKNI